MRHVWSKANANTQLTVFDQQKLKLSNNPPDTLETAVMLLGSS